MADDRNTQCADRYASDHVVRLTCCIIRKRLQNWWLQFSSALVRVLAGWHRRLVVMCSTQTFTLLRPSSILSNICNFLLLLSTFNHRSADRYLSCDVSCQRICGHLCKRSKWRNVTVTTDRVIMNYVWHQTLRVSLMLELSVMILAAAGKFTGTKNVICKYLCNMCWYLKCGFGWRWRWSVHLIWQSKKCRNSSETTKNTSILQYNRENSDGFIIIIIIYCINGIFWDVSYCYMTTLCFKKQFTLLVFTVTKSDVDQF